ncbi:MAG: hypothetical protein H6573_25020 [Lewinellaceae bacterium]|nr:hypothetical protein [Phaeodactylibacter sp.]MCB9350742.1 hypothetical protein [Lewinellaceae bacterium]
MRNVLLIAFMLFILSTLSAQFTFSGVFTPADTEYEYAHQLSWEALQQQHEALDAKGFRLTDIETAKAGAHRYYWAIWKKDEVHSILKRIESWDSLVIVKREMAADSFVMDEIEAYTYGDKEYYLAVWTPGYREHKIRKLTSWEGVENDYENLSRRDLQLVDIESFDGKDGITQYLALYQWEGPEFKTFYYRSHDYDDFITDKGYRQKSGYHLFDYERFKKRDMSFYVGLYKAEENSRRLEDHYNWEDFSKLMAEQKEQNNVVLTDIDVYVEEKER